MPSNKKSRGSVVIIKEQSSSNSGSYITNHRKDVRPPRNEHNPIETRRNGKNTIKIFTKK